MENDEDKLSAEYFCSLHSKNPETAGDEFDAKVEQIYKALKDSSVERKEDIPYKPNGELTQIDIWGPENAQKVFIMIHGGYWLFGNRKKCLAVVGVAQSLGYTVVSIGYDYANKDHPLRQTIQEAIDGVQFALDRFENAKKVVIGGHSVGAHLAFQAITRIQDPRIRQILICYDIICYLLVCYFSSSAIAGSSAILIISKQMSICPRISGAFLSAGIYKLHELVNTKYGRDLGLTPEEAALCSCDYDLLKTVAFPILIANCKLESPKLFQQNVEFSQLVKNAQYKEYAGEDHFSILTELTNENSVVNNDFYKFLHSI